MAAADFVEYQYPLIVDILHQTGITDMDEYNTDDCLSSSNDISQEENTLLPTLSQQLNTAKCQITHDMRNVTSWDRFLAFLSLHTRMTLTKYTYAIMAAAF